VHAEDMARRWLDLPESASRDPDGRRLITRAAGRLYEEWTARADSVGAGRGAAAEMVSEWSRLAPLLETHVDAESALHGRADGGPDLPGMLLAALGQGGLPLASSVLRRLQDPAGVSGESSPAAGEPLPESLSPILQYIAMSFHPVLRVNRALLAEGKRHMTVDLGYGPLEMPCQPAWEDSRQALARDLAALPDDDRADIRRQLAPLGVPAVYESA